MSTDITIEAHATTSLSFDDFTSERLPRLGRVAMVLAQDPDIAAAALAAGVRSVFNDWSRQRNFEEAEQHVFATAVQHYHDTDRGDSDVAATGAGGIISSAVDLAHHVFGWDGATIRRTVALGDAVTFTDPGNREFGEQLRRDVAQSEPALIDLAAITAPAKPQRKRVAPVALAAAGALLALGALAQFVAQPDRADTVQDARGQVANAIEPAPFERPSFPGESMVLEPPLPAAERAPSPSLITSGSTDGFVGVRPPATPDGEVTFLSSRSGVAWVRIGTSQFGQDTTVSRFERVDDHFALWFETSASRQSQNTRLALSDDLVNWTVLELPREQQPYGLLYQTRIADVSISGDVALALVSTEVEIDFTALSLSEGYTCGHSIADDAVSVNMCNNSQLDVLSFSTIDRLPPPVRLFVSQSGQPFERTAEPFGRETEVQLARFNDAFAIADDTGVRFATSSDGRTWLASPARKPRFPVRASAANATGQVFGAGTNAAGEPVLFFNNGPNTTSTQLSQIVADASIDATVLVAAAPTRWVAYVYEPDGRAWIAASSDGLNWNVADAAAPTGTHVELIASDNQALVQSTQTDGTTTTASMPLP